MYQRLRLGRRAESADQPVQGAEAGELQLAVRGVRAQHGQQRRHGVQHGRLCAAARVRAHAAERRAGEARRAGDRGVRVKHVRHRRHRARSERFGAVAVAVFAQSKQRAAPLALHLHVRRQLAHHGHHRLHRARRARARAPALRHTNAPEAEQAG